MSTSPSNPIPRSTSTTVVASVFDCVATAVSRIRMTSPPILLGRKLLKKVATRYDPSSVLPGTFTSCACSNKRQREVLASMFTKYTPSAAMSHGTDALRALAQGRAVSIFEKRNASSAALTTIFAVIMSTRRPSDAGADGVDSSGMQLWRRTRHCTTDSSRSSLELTPRGKANRRVDRGLSSQPTIDSSDDRDS